MTDQAMPVSNESAPAGRPKFSDLPLSEQMKASAMLADELLEGGVLDSKMPRDAAIDLCHQQLATLSDDFFELPKALFELSDEDLGALIHDLVNNPPKD
jgi:hypothetical protein